MEDEAPLAAPPLRPPLSNTSTRRDLEPSSDDMDKIRRWQEERIARKLRGEYESTMLYLGELINGNLNTPLRIASIRIEGAPHTRSSFLGWLIKPHLRRPVIQSSESAATTVETVLTTTRRVTRVLLETDIFSVVEPRIELSRDILAKAGDVDVVFRTKEKGKWFLKTATELGDGEGSASIQARIRNALGGAETLEASLGYGTKTRRAFNIGLSAPLIPSLRTKGEIFAFGLEKDYSSYASCMEEARGIKAVIRAHLTSGTHEFAYEAVLRHICNLTPTASLSIREAAGPTSKSAISHTWLRDTRNDKIAATRGSYLRTFQELAGLGGDASFFKSQSNFQLSRPISSGSSVSFSAQAGVIWPLFSRPTLFSDRFQLGGPLDVRMFRQCGMGPRDGPDSLGGDLHWATGVSLISDLPRKPHWPLKTHLFVNVGRLDALDRSKLIFENITACISQPSISAGVGLLYRFDPVRVELNFGVPLVASKSDGHRKGFQVGMGLEFS